MAKSNIMKKLFVYAAAAMFVVSCGNNSTSGNGSEDTTSPASGATGQGLDGQGTTGGTGTGTDTTGLDVGAVQPIDSSVNSRTVQDEPGAGKSGVNDSNQSGGAGNGGQ
jgi:hypothetical protein